MTVLYVSLTGGFGAAVEHFDLSWGVSMSWQATASTYYSVDWRVDGGVPSEIRERNKCNSPLRIRLVVIAQGDSTEVFSKWTARRLVPVGLSSQVHASAGPPAASTEIS